jgi:hypothetical protein
MNPKYKANKKNGGRVPVCIDKRVLYVPIGCDKCIECRKKKSRDWKVRLQEEIKDKENGKFVTLTFNRESLEKLRLDVGGATMWQKDNMVATRAVRLFLERWRKKYKKSVRHWLVTELGGNNTERIHLHGIIWTDEPMETIEKYWQYGFVGKGRYNIKQDKWENYVNMRTVNYIVKYVTKIDEKHKEYKSIVLTSAGIGKAYTKKFESLNNKYQGKNTREYYKAKTGEKVALPIYYRNKIYSDDEREKLWIIKLDENVRYVMGEKIDMNRQEDSYWKLLEWYRKENRIMGYDSLETWNEEEYRNKINDMMMDIGTRRIRIRKKEEIEPG